MITKLKTMFTNIYTYLYVGIVIFWFYLTLRHDAIDIRNIHFKVVLPIILLSVLVWFIHKLFNSKYDRWMAIVGVIILIIWQIYVVITASMPLPNDPAHMFNALTNPALESAYFSLYNNNLFILYIYKILQFIIPCDLTWTIINMFNLIIVDSAFIVIVLTAYSKNKEHLNAYIAIAIVNLGLFSFILHPYTDTFPLLATAVYTYNFVNCKTWKNSLCMGFALPFMVLIKPSLWVFFIATLLFKWSTIRNVSTLKNAKKIIFTFSVSFICLFGGFKFAIATQPFIELQDNIVTPSPLHWMNMGLKGHGGYNQKDVDAMLKLSTKKEQNDYSIKGIKKSIKEKKISGLLKHLIIKFSCATQFKPHTCSLPDTKDTVRDHLSQKLFWNNGEYNKDCRLLGQLVWVFDIGLLLFTLTDKKTNYFKLVIVGGLSFLMLFESGRSRYLIQFFPALMPLIMLSYKEAKVKIPKIIKTVNHPYPVKGRGFSKC